MKAIVLSCPECRGRCELDAEYRAYAEQMRGAPVQKSEGMIQMCAHCGEILVFEPAAPARGVKHDRVRKITDEELACIPLWVLAGLGRQQDEIRAQRAHPAVPAAWVPRAWVN